MLQRTSVKIVEMSRYGGSGSGYERGRPQNRYADTGDALSSFYRDRFGSQSPEQYLNLRISQMDKELQRDEIKEILYREFKKYAPFEIKVVRNPGDEDRLAYVNFEREDAARKIRHTMLGRLQKLLGRRILVDPAGIVRDQEGKFIPDRFNRQNMQGDRDRSPHGRGGRTPPPRRRDMQATWRLKEDDQEATRTLFVGNMPVDIKEVEIRRVFEKYGKVEEIDIKNPADTNASYAFVMFSTIDQAIEAKHAEHERSIRTGGPKCKIGYGKSQVSRRLWVGNLGSWCNADLLAKEFDRYGLIEKLEYEEGDDHAHICFNDSNAASDACRAMKGFSFGGKDQHIQVDFAKDETAPPSTNHRKRLATSGSPPPTKGKHIRTMEEMDNEYAFTWQGHVTLKKSEYSVRLYRIAGTEKMLQTVLRDSDGNALKLNVTQRLALATQDSLQDRLLSSDVKQLAIMIGVGKVETELKPFVNYLVDKDAAGVVTVPEGIVYIFPYSDMSSKIVSRFASSIKVLTEGCPYLLFVLGPKPVSSNPTPEP